MTENELWSVMHQGMIALGGDYVDTRLLSSGERTNPWFQETGERRMGENEPVALDTDVVGWTSENRATTAPPSPA